MRTSTYAIIIPRDITLVSWFTTTTSTPRCSSLVLLGFCFSFSLFFSYLFTVVALKIKNACLALLFTVKVIPTEAGWMDWMELNTHENVLFVT